MTKTIKIDGMSCMHCSNAVSKALQALDGVSGVNVDLEGKAATVECTDAVSDEDLREAIEEEGYDVIEIA